MSVLFAAKLIVWAYGLTVSARATTAYAVKTRLPKQTLVAAIIDPSQIVTAEDPNEQAVLARQLLRVNSHDIADLAKHLGELS